MAARAPRPCNKPHCSTLSRDGSGYCPEHKSLASGWMRQNRGTRHQRGYGSEWVKLRKAVLSRDSRLCQVCMAGDRVKVANAVDHIKPKSAGGTDSMSNLQSICTACHGAKTAREGRGMPYFPRFST